MQECAKERNTYGRATSDKTTLATMLGYEIIMPLGSERKRKDKRQREGAGKGVREIE